MKLLITGGCGFLGSNLAGYAIENQYDVVVFDNLSRAGAYDNYLWLKRQGEFKFIQGDIRNTNDVDRLIKEFAPDFVFHLAGQVAMTTSILNPRKDFEINTLGTYNLLEAIRNYSPRSSVFYSSTNKVYGDLEQFQYEETPTRYKCLDYSDGFDEKVPLEFHSPYGCSKGAADQYMLDYYRIFGIHTTVFRHSSMYGGRQFSTVDQGWIGWFCQKAYEVKKNISNQPFTISGSGKQVRDVLHAEDMINLYFSALNNADKIKGRAFNVGGGMENSLSLLELFSFLEEYLNISLNYDRLPPRESDQRVFVANINNIANAIGWRPNVSYKQGIIKMLNWIEEM